jgi:hypothetical protein
MANSKGDGHQVLWITAAVCLFCFTVLFVWTVMQAYRYLSQLKYRCLSVVSFYTCALTIEVARIAMYSNMIAIFNISEGFLSHAYISNFAYVVAIFMKVILGFFQFLSMAELAIRIRQLPSFESKIRTVRWSVFVVNSLAFITMMILAVGFMFYTNPENTTFSEFQNYLRIVGIVTAIFNLTLSIAMTVSYLALRRALKLVSADASVGGNLTMLFFILLLSYLLRTVEALFNGNYDKFFPSFFRRQEYEMILWLCLDTMCIAPCLLLHKRNFKGGK